MKKNITISISAEKLSALEMYLGQKNTSLMAELEKQAEQLYLKNVPQNVRDFIEQMSAVKPEPKPGKPAISVTESDVGR